MTFHPRLETLPSEQRQLWPALAQVPRSFVLYGGTALALRLGHRTSVDFDFFSSEPLDDERMFRLPLLAAAEVLQQEPETLTVSVRSPESDGGSAPVKLSFFGGIAFGRVGDPDLAADGGVQVASLLDLFATKLKVLLQRISVRDYADLAAVLRTGLALDDGLGAAAALFGETFPIVDAVKALTYFQGDAARVSDEDQEVLEDAVARWNCGVSAIVRRDPRLSILADP